MNFVCGKSFYKRKISDETVTRTYLICLQKFRQFSKNNASVTKPLDFAPTYKPEQVERNKLKNWTEKSNFLEPNGPKFSIILPPPNITGTLHLGHALAITVEDVLVRWHRMRGYNTKWIPGIDHAGIATQVVVEKKLWQERGKTRHQIGRDKFLEEVWTWKDEKTKIIRSQLELLGASLDWPNFTFTLDQKQSRAVNEAFVLLFDKGLIYRSEALVNWSCVLQSAISDIEVDQVKIPGKTEINVPGYERKITFGCLTYVAYKICDSNEEIVVATTRPETILGDVAIAVHPNDPRYNKFRNKFAWHPFRNEKIPIIFDEFVDPEFGSGAVKITPAHDLVDFRVGAKHGLRNVSVFDEHGCVVAEFGASFARQKRFDVRDRVFDMLTQMGLIRGVYDHEMVVPICSRSKDVIEYLLKPQWFVRCKELAEKAVLDVREGNLKIVPKTYETVWFNWMENIRDWCISRQLWWGHLIPVYECWTRENSTNRVWIAAASEIEARQKAQIKLDSHEIELRQDNDVLDTWFSSSLLPFSAFGWPENTENLQQFYPLTMMETGHDILFFWVARMVMLGKELTGKLPFEKVLLHGIICDSHGRKMSKSLGNVIRPEDVINGASLTELKQQTIDNFKAGLITLEESEKIIEGQKKMFPVGIPSCGADALRFTLCSHNIKNNFVYFDVDECNTNRLFCNKIWQATKFTRMAVDRLGVQDKLDDVQPDSLSLMDQWIMSQLARLVENVNQGIQDADLHLATSTLKSFFYYDFCDTYLESTKPALRTNNDDAELHANALAHCSTLCKCLDVGLRCLAPFMPFLTDKLYSRIPRTTATALLHTRFPQTFEYKHYRNEDLEKEVDLVKDIVVAIRRLRSQSPKGQKSKEKPLVYIQSTVATYRKFADVIETLTGCQCSFHKSFENYVSDTVGADCTVHVMITPKSDNLKSEQPRNAEIMWSKKEAKLIQELGKLMLVSDSDGFKEKASEKVQQSHAEKIKKISEELQQIKQLKEKSGI